MNSTVMYSARTVEWPTPQWLFDALHSEFGFDIDVCASPEFAKCERFYSKDQDGLNQSWIGVCWMNPPYGREIGKWIKKAYESSLNGATIVCLVPARTDTSWWHQYVMRSSEIRFLRGRVKFGTAKHGAPFPSAIVIFRPSKPQMISAEVAP